MKNFPVYLCERYKYSIIIFYYACTAPHEPAAVPVAHEPAAVPVHVAAPFVPAGQSVFCMHYE